MPELMENIEDEKVIEGETTSKINPLLTMLVGIAIGGLGGYSGNTLIDESTMQEKIQNSKYEIVKPIITPEKITETMIDTVISGDSVTVTRTDTTSARREYFRSIALGYIAPVSDTIIISYTRKRGDSILYYGIAPLEIGDCIRGDFKVDKMN